MHFLVDENIHGELVRRLRFLGYDVYWICESDPGVLDYDLLEHSIKEKRIIITFDKDFGKLIFYQPRHEKCGIKLIRINDLPPDEFVERVISTITIRDDWQDYFSVIEKDRVRMAPLDKF